jgi:predicted  nucleic acid-binding Zn-ribbon protein
LRGVSFGYYTVKSAPDVVNGQKIRRLKEVKHIETSVLTELPANPLTGVVSLTKSLKEIIELKKLSNEEQNALKSIILSDSNVLMTLVNLSSKLESSSDLYTWINYNISRRADMIGDLRGQIKYNSEEITAMKSYLSNAEKFVKESKASDEAILSIDSEIKKIKDIITEYDTAFTGLATQPNASVNENKSLNEAILLLTTKHF